MQTRIKRYNSRIIVVIAFMLATGATFAPRQSARAHG